MDYTQIIIRIFIALLAGLIVGYEREKTDRPAGLKTHTLTVIGSTVFTLTGLKLFLDFQGVINLDPLRIIVAVATGIGFIGAGSIIRSGDSVKGLSVAASVWLMGAVGIAIGFGYYFIALVAVVLCFLIIEIIEKIEKKRKKS